MPGVPDSHPQEAMEGSPVSEVKAYSLSIARNRGMMLALGLAGCFTLLVGIRYSLVSPLFTPTDTAIFVGGLCVYGPCTALLFVIKGKHLYHVMVPWIGSTLVLGMSLVLNSLFGTNGTRLLQDQVPVYLGFVPILVVFAYTYLTARHAGILCGLYSLILAAGGGIFTAMHWSVAIHSPAIIFLMMTLLIANPAVMGMMHLTRSLHLEASRHLERALANERRKRAAAERSREIDPVTLVLNRDGAVHSLRRWLGNENVPVRGVVLCALLMDEHEAHEGKTPRVEWGQILRQISQALQGALGPKTEVCRLGGTQFLVWNREIDPDANPRGIGMQVFARLQALELGLKPSPSFSVGVARARPGQSADMLIEAANFQLFLAHSRGGAQLCVAEDAR